MDPDLDLVTRIARRVVRRFPDASLEDVVQEIALWWCAHPRVVERYAGEDATEQDSLRFELILRRVGEAYARVERAAARGYDVTDEFFYSAKIIKSELLAWMFDPNRRAADTDPQGRHQKPVPGQGMNVETVLADMWAAYRTLSEQDQVILALYGGRGYSYVEIGELLNAKANTVRMRVNRAIRRMVEHLGGESPYGGQVPRGRRAIPNATAQAITRAQEGDAA